MSNKKYTTDQIETWFKNLPVDRKYQIFEDCFEFPQDLDYLNNGETNY